MGENCGKKRHDFPEFLVGKPEVRTPEKCEKTGSGNFQNPFKGDHTAEIAGQQRSLETTILAEDDLTPAVVRQANDGLRTENLTENGIQRKEESVGRAEQSSQRFGYSDDGRGESESRLRVNRPEVKCRHHLRIRGGDYKKNNPALESELSLIHI